MYSTYVHVNIKPECMYTELICQMSQPHVTHTGNRITEDNMTLIIQQKMNYWKPQAADVLA